MRRGFTLIEILVVIGIISLLKAILLPVLSSARKRSQSAVCLSNLSQIGKAISMYAADYDERLPYAPSPDTKRRSQDGESPFNDPQLDELARTLPPVNLLLKPYTTDLTIWRCPLDNVDSKFRQEKKYAATWYETCGSSYQYDEHSGLLTRMLSHYPKSAEWPLVYDIGHNHGGGDSGDGIVQVVFADMHVKPIKFQTLAEEIVETYEE